MASTFEKTFASLHARVEKAITRLKFPESTLGKASAYSLSAGGKRLRPILTLVAAAQRGTPKFDPMPMALAIECVHTFSLIHDDMPCIDNATLRRGKKCCHKVFGEAAGLLAGDTLLNKAFQIVSDAYPVELAGKLCGMLAHTADELLEGEWADIEAERLPAGKVDLDFIYMNKTARMIGLPIMAGLTLAGFKEDVVRRQGVAAEKVGIAFQLVDDLLDITSNKKKLGKDVAQDERKKTFLKQYGQVWCEEFSRRLSDEAVETFRELPRPEFLIALTGWLLKRDF
jgi:geranylgeranyl diphosphate synthase, type II